MGFELKEWRVWAKPDYAEGRLRQWKSPLLPQEKWDRHKAKRLSLIPQLIKGSSVLDVGCGLGHCYATIKDGIDEYLGIDLKAMIDICHRFFPENLFKAGDIYNLSSIGMYDTVLCIQVLIHLPTLEKPLKQLWAHTKQRLIFTIRPPTRLFKKRFKQRESGLIGHDFNRTELTNAINSLGGVEKVSVYKSPFLPKRVFFIIIDKNPKKNVKINQEIFLYRNAKEM